MIVMLTPKPVPRAVPYQQAGSSMTHARLILEPQEPVEAMRFDGQNHTAIAQWCGGFAGEPRHEGARHIEDSSGTIHLLFPGMWLVREPLGAYVPYADEQIDASFIR